MLRNQIKTSDDTFNLPSVLLQDTMISLKAQVKKSLREISIKKGVKIPNVLSEEY